MTAQKLRQVDQNGLKTGQTLTIGLLILGFVLDVWPLVAFVALAQLLGALGTPYAPYALFYRHVLRDGGIVQPRVLPDNPEPHRFAMLVGAVFNGVATLALLTGLPLLGWVLVGIVVILANLNLWVGFCLGCWVYYRLNRLGVPGFKYAPVKEQGR